MGSSSSPVPLAVLATLTLSACNQEYRITKLEPTTVAESETSIVFKSLKPALAVRGAGCLMCHANIESTVITDFGAGDSFFLNASVGFYLNHVEAWQTASIQGALVVPRAQVTRAGQPGALNLVDPARNVAEMSLADFLRSDQIANTAGNSIGNVGPLSRGASQGVIEKNSVYIGAPTEAQILAIAPSLAGRDAAFAEVAVPGLTRSNSLALRGLEVAQNPAGGKYVRNVAGQELVCAGDVVVSGTLFLDQVVIRSDDNGCRLYVTESVFVQGEVRYTGASKANLQITSARAIMMGFNQQSLSERLSLSGERAWLVNEFYTRAAGDSRAKNQLIHNDSLKVIGLVDAFDDSTGYERILLNAPQVHGRAKGPVRGAIVAEIALFNLGDFAFSFDPVFESAPVFPALKTDILRVE